MKRSVLAVLTLCAVAPPAGYIRAPGPGTVRRTVVVGSVTRTYFLHVPPGLPPDRPAPLVLVFHGGGGTPAYAERDTRFSELADHEGFLVAYPEGVGRSWNDGRGEQAIAAQREGMDDLGFVARLIDDVSRDHPVDSRRVFATGISNGAIFAHYLGARLSSRIAAIAPVAGGIPARWAARFHPEQPVSVLILQGTADPLMPYAGGPVTLPGGTTRGDIIPTDEAVRKWVMRDGARDAAAERDLDDRDAGDRCRVRAFVHAGGDRGTEVVLYRLDGAGHTWPGGKQYLPARLVGRVCRDIDGAAVIWEFFKNHPRP